MENKEKMKNQYQYVKEMIEKNYEKSRILQMKRSQKLDGKMFEND